MYIAMVTLHDCDGMLGMIDYYTCDFCICNGGIYLNNGLTSCQSNSEKMLEIFDQCLKSTLENYKKCLKTHFFRFIHTLLIYILRECLEVYSFGLLAYF